MGHRQKGKNKKRSKSWHRGNGESFRWLQSSASLPQVANDIDPTQASPVPLRRKGVQNRGDAV